MRRLSALGLLAVACAACSSTASEPSRTPKPAIVDATDPSSCLVRDARGGTISIPWNDPARMKELEGIAPKSTAKVSIQWPAEDQVLDEGKGLVRYKVEGFDVGKDEKAKFQHCRIVLDNTGFANDDDGKTTLEALNGGSPLAEGSHLLTIFPVRSCGLSLKNEGACAQVRFHVKVKKGKLPANDTEQVIYNLPDGTYDSGKGEAHNVLCDFQIKSITMTNERLIKDLNVVVVVVDPAGKRETIKATDWAPFIVLRDPKPGVYKVTVSLEERDDGDPMDVPFGEPTREITIK